MVVPLAMLYQMLAILYIFALMHINRNRTLLLITLLANCDMTLLNDTTGCNRIGLPRWQYIKTKLYRVSQENVTDLIRTSAKDLARINRK